MAPNNFQLTVLSPLSILDGDELDSFGYYIRNEKLNVIDYNKFLKGSEGVKRLTDVLDKCPEDKFESNQSVPSIGEILSDDQLDGCLKYSINANIKNPDSHYPIKTAIKTAGTPFIPGSSIKGSILSAMYWYVLTHTLDKSLARGFLTRTHNSKEVSNAVFKAIVGSQKGSSFSQWLRVSDSSTLPLDSLELRLSKRLSSKDSMLNKPRKPSGIPVFVEAIAKGNSVSFEMEKLQLTISLSKMLEIVDEFYRKVLDEEIKWCQQNHIDFDFSEIKQSKYILKLGAGSSRFATSLQLAARDLGVESEYHEKNLKGGPKINPKLDVVTRSFLFNKLMMPTPSGWVKITGV